MSISKSLFIPFLLFFLFFVFTPLTAQEHRPVPPLRINSPSLFGVRPNHPLFFKVAATGEKPLTYLADRLPPSLSLDAKTGILTGNLPQQGEWHFTLIVKEVSGKSCSQPFTLYVGEEIGLTPPMGWNSWYSYSESVSDEKIRAMAQAMVSTGLIDHGYSYINIDDCWQGERDPQSKALQGNERFPDMKQLTDFIHSLGLKAGIYSTPWISTYAGFRGSSSDSPTGEDPDNALPLAERLQPNQLFGRYPGLHRIQADRQGAVSFAKADANQWAQWGFDYLKLDWNPNDPATAKAFYTALRHSGRDLILSLSNNAPFEEAQALSESSNLWRTTGDIVDTWYSIAKIVKRHHRFQPFSRPGHFNDPDMLQIGSFGTPNTFVKEAKLTRLTPAQQQSQLAYWCLFAAPLLLSCDLTQLDPFSIKLLTNDHLIAINQDPLGKQAKLIENKGGYSLLKKELAGNAIAIGIFNDLGIPRTFQKDLTPYLKTEAQSVFDCIVGESLTPAQLKSYTIKLPAYGVSVLRIQF